jgi:UPF0271 protein
MHIDLNCDLGEGCKNDAELLKLVSSANIACGGHAGDESTMRDTVRMALACGVAIGAHPGFCDREGFGRREINISPREAGKLVEEQVGALQRIARREGGEVRHIKLHGALYNMAARDVRLARGIAVVLRDMRPVPLLVCPPKSALEETASREFQITTVPEVFADRGYRQDGSLIPRDRPGAVLEDPELAANRILHLMKTGSLKTAGGSVLSLRAETVCIHGDAPDALVFTMRFREVLARNGVMIRSFSRIDGAGAAEEPASS